MHIKKCGCGSCPEIIQGIVPPWSKASECWYVECSDMGSFCSHNFHAALYPNIKEAVENWNELMRNNEWCELNMSDTESS